MANNSYVNFYRKEPFGNNFGFSFCCRGCCVDYCNGCFLCQKECCEETQRYLLLLCDYGKVFFQSSKYSTHCNFLFASERKQLGPLLAIVNKSKLNFSYETLERATNYFDQSNKLGQGGSGSVYKVLFCLSLSWAYSELQKCKLNKKVSLC